MTLKAMEDPKSIQKRFEAAVKVIRSLPEDGSYDMSDDMLVMFYSYYKQATEGPCNRLKPNSWDPIGKAKWEAWKGLGNMSKDQAMMEYVQEILLIIETIPVTDRMAELMDALDPFYELVEDDDEDMVSKAEPFSTESTDAEMSDDDGGKIKDYMEMEKWTDSISLSAERSLPAFNKCEEISMSGDDTHSSLNSEDEEEELVYDDSDDEMDGDSVQKPAAPEKGSGGPRVLLADMSVVGANMTQGGNREPQCGSQDGKPQGVQPPVPHPPALGTVRTDRIPACSGRGHQLIETSLPDEPTRRCLGDGQCWETEDRRDKRALDTQITVILSQLQDNMQDVLHRLNTLELELTASQAEMSPLKTWHSKSPKKRWPWWPLSVSPFTAVLTVLWPFAVHLLVQFYLHKRRRWLSVK